MVSVHLQPYGCSFTWQRKVANAVPVEPCILRHQWSAETLNGPISIFHLPSYDNKICRAQHNKHSEYPTSLLVTSPNRDIRTDEAPKPNGSFERAGSRLTWFVPSAPLLHWFYSQMTSHIQGFVHCLHTENWVIHSACKRRLIKWKSLGVIFNTISLFTCF